MMIIQQMETVDAHLEGRGVRCMSGQPCTTSDDRIWECIVLGQCRHVPRSTERCNHRNSACISCGGLASMHYAPSLHMFTKIALWHWHGR